MATVGVTSSRTPHILGSAQFALSPPASCHTFLSRAIPNAPFITKMHDESENCVTHSNLSPSINSRRRASSPSSRRQRQRLARFVTFLSLAEAPKTVVEEESGVGIGTVQKIFYNSWIQRMRDGKTFNLHWGVITSMAVVVSSLLVNSPAFAGVGLTDEGWVQFWIAWVVIAIMYLLVIPLVLYNYLRLRWYKRKLPEAFLQFGLVFLFFPGLLLLAPFINFRRLPRNNAKEPWDDPRSL